MKGRITRHGVYLVTFVLGLSLLLGSFAPLSPAWAREGDPATVVVSSAWVYSIPSFDGDVVGQLSHGQWINALARTADSAWLRIRLDDGRVGWVPANTVELGGGLPLGVVPVFEGAPGGSDGLGAEPVGVLIWDFVPLRSAPACEGFGYLGDLRLGESVSLIGRSADSAWLQIRAADGRVGWVKTDVISTGFPLTNLPVTDSTDRSLAPSVVVMTDMLNVRYGPSLGYGIVARVYQGQALPVTGYRSADYGWVKVWLDDGRKGWVNTCCVQPRGFSFSQLKALSCTSFAPTTHLVRAGESLNQIAAQYGVDPLALAAYNNLVNYQIYPGQVLMIP